MKKRENNIKKKQSKIKEYKNLFNLKNNKLIVDVTPNEVKHTLEYINYKKLNSKKENISFFFNWSTIIGVISFFYCLITELVKKISSPNFISHIVIGSICIFSIILSIIFGLLILYLLNSKKAKKIVDDYNQIIS